MSAVTYARDFAAELHRKQDYTVVLPYVAHLADVVQNLELYGLATAHRTQVAWLHDTLEDTTATVAGLTLRFGAKVADDVFALTGEGITRRERNEDWLRKIFNETATGNLDPLAVKLCDRLANVERNSGGPMVRMYRDEYPAFRAALYSSQHTEFAAIWEKLDRLLG